jgi:hypothetical protein
MKRTRYKTKREQGNATVVALMLLAVLTLIGLAVSRIAGIDTQIAGNQIPYRQSFYVAEGGVNREAAEVGRGNYPVTNVNAFYDPQNPEETRLATEGGLYPSGTLPGPSHVVSGESYKFELQYMGHYVPPAGYSAVHFSRYDYMINAEGGEADVRVGSRYYKIGPKAG